MTEQMGEGADVDVLNHESEPTIREMCMHVVQMLPDKMKIALFRDRLGVEKLKDVAEPLRTTPNEILDAEQDAQRCVFNYVEHAGAVYEDHELTAANFHVTRHIPLYRQVFGNSDDQVTPAIDIENLTAVRHDGVANAVTVAETQREVAQMLKLLGPVQENYPMHNLIGKQIFSDEEVMGVMLHPYSFETQQMYHDRIEALGIEALNNSRIYTINLASRPVSLPQQS